MASCIGFKDNCSGMDVTLQQFTGPLDLLLSLIEDEKLDVSEIALAHVTEQYLTYLETDETSDPEALADFLVIATRLLLLKSKVILPDLTPDDEGGQSLEAQLRLYRAFVRASRSVSARWVSSVQSFFRFEPPRYPTTFVAPGALTLPALRDSMRHLVARLQPPKPLPETTIDSTVSMKEKIQMIREFLGKKKSFSLHEVIASAENKTELIVCFLAILELLKQHVVHLQQQDTFSDIVIHRV